MARSEGPEERGCLRDHSAYGRPCQNRNFPHGNFAHCVNTSCCSPARTCKAIRLQHFPIRRIRPAPWWVSYHLASVPYSVYLLDPLRRSKSTSYGRLRLNSRMRSRSCVHLSWSVIPTTILAALLKAVRNFDEKKLALIS